MPEVIYWYNVLSSCYGFRFATPEERQTFFHVVETSTSAKNKEVCDAIILASAKGIRPKEQYGRVGTGDVIAWIEMIRRKAPARKSKEQVEADFISRWKGKVSTSADLSAMSDEAWCLPMLYDDDIKKLIRILQD